MSTVEWIKPRAFLVSRLARVKIIAELPNGKYTFLLPPNYEIEDEDEKYAFEAAVSKYGYQLVKEESVINSEKELEIFLKWFK